MTSPAARLTLHSRSAEETEQLARRIAETLRGGETIALIGQIGSGKTTWVHGLAAGLGCPSMPSSPTFVLQQWYRGRLLLCHLDLYRLDDPEEIARIGLLEPLDTHQVTVIEWADRAGGLLPADRLDLTFQAHDSETERTILAQPHGRGHDHLMTALKSS
ncbi:MAG: tRNA (adenosine(37)-N6)-threonylcarbamoyltransferase complex ATPase subunit type 1 TsaE [Nitrospirota bacterium]